MMALLSLPATEANSAKLQQAALLALVDGFDRKLLREKYIEVAELTLGLKDAIARQSVVGSIDELFRAGDLTQEEMDTALTALDRMVERSRINLLEAMANVVRCPTSADTVN